MAAPPVPGPASPDPAAPPLGRLDALLAVVLLGASALVRRDSYPTDGLWLDDAWVAVAARAPVSDLWTVSWNHPGFTFLMQVVNSVEPDRVDVLAWPVLAVGVVSVPLLFLAYRWLGFGLVASAPAAVLVAVNRTHAVYSGRIKPYVFELAGIALLAVALHALVRRRWRWPHGAAWLVVALAVSSTSAFGFAAAAIAMLVLALHPAGDRAVRVVVLAVQGAVQLATGLSTRSRYDTEEVAAIWDRHYDAYFELSEGPVDVVRQVGRHLVELARAWVDLPAPAAVLVLALSAVGLAWACVRGEHRALARFLSALVAVAFVGAFLRQVPFGPKPDGWVFPGTRGSIWLYPSLGFGLAVTIRQAMGLGSGRARQVVVVVTVAATAALGLIQADLHPEYGVLGNRTATAFIEQQRDESTVVFYLDASTYIVASEPPVPFTIEPAPERIEGFTPRMGAGRVEVPPLGQLTLERVTELVDGSDHVIVHNSLISFGDGAVVPLGERLVELGFELQSTEVFAANGVQTWRR